MAKKTPTEAALTFLSLRNPFDDLDHPSWVFMLMDFQDKKGDDAVQALAGFYLYAIKNIGGEKGTEAIQTTFAHDMNGRNEKWCEPRSSAYLEVWEKEIKNSYLLN